MSKPTPPLQGSGLTREGAVDQLLALAKLADDDQMRDELEALASRFSLPPRPSIPPAGLTGEDGERLDDIADHIEAGLSLTDEDTALLRQLSQRALASPQKAGEQAHSDRLQEIATALEDGMVKGDPGNARTEANADFLRALASPAYLQSEHVVASSALASPGEGQVGTFAEALEQVGTAIRSPEVTEKAGRKLGWGFSLAEPAERLWAEALVVLGEAQPPERYTVQELAEEACAYLEGLARQSLKEAEGGGGELSGAAQQALYGKAEGYTDAAEYLRTNHLAAPPSQSPPSPGEAGEGLREALAAEIEVRRDWAAEHRDLATRSDMAESGEEDLAKAQRRDEDTDRLQAILDAASTLPTSQAEAVQLRITLTWLLNQAEALVAGEPVRNLDEAISEAKRLTEGGSLSKDVLDWAAANMPRDDQPPTSAPPVEDRERFTDAFCDYVLDELIVIAGGRRGYTSNKVPFARWDMKAALEKAAERAAPPSSKDAGEGQ